MEQIIPPVNDPRPLPLDVDAILPMIRGLTPLHDHVALFDGDGRVAWLSDGLASACGGARCFKGRAWSEFVAEPSEGERLARRLEEAGRLSNEPVRLVGPAGRRRQASVSAARLGPPGLGSPAVAIFRMDPDAERLDRELRLRLDYLAAILDSAPEGVVVVDRSRFITYANPAMATLTGYAVDELVDRPLALFLHAQEDVDRIVAALRPESAAVRNQDVEVRRRDGSRLCTSVSASLLRVADGTPVGAVAYVRDVTERKRWEEHLARKNEELEHYVHAVSHDLRSPLVAMLGYARLLQDDFAEVLGERGRHYATRIEEAGRIMEALIHDLLELSRIGNRGLQRDWVEPREVLLQLEAELKPRLEAGDVSFQVPEAPPLVCCDRTRLYQLFSNLIGNALDHMGECESPTIRVEIHASEGGHRIRVADNGRGIPPEEHERIFEIFQSLGPRRRSGAGTGIGLAIVKKIAESHGGGVRVQSAPGQGATFEVFLPAG